MRHICAFACSLVFVWGTTMRAQSDPSLAQGLIPYLSYQGGNIDNINLTNGALNITIPLIGYPQRGGALKLNFSAVYNSKAWARTLHCVGSGTNQSCLWLWGSTLSQTSTLIPLPASDDQFDVVDDQDIQEVPDPYNFTYGGEQQYRYIAEWRTSDGAVHHGAVVGSNPQAADQMSLDGTGFSVPLGYITGCTGLCPTTDTNGISYYPSTNTAPVLREDANGNTVSLQYSQGTDGTVTGYIDTVGRIIPIATSTTNYSGCSGSLPTSSAYQWQIPGANGSTLTYTFCYASVSICVPGSSPDTTCGTSFPYQGGTPIEPYQGSQTLLQSIVLPNNTTWTFVYSDRNPGDPDTVNYGDLSEIIFPTGGSISYQYALQTGPTVAGSNVSMAIMSRAINANDGTGPYTWTYTYSQSDGVTTQTTVADPLGEQTVHVFGEYPYETETTYYSGAAGSSQVLKSIARTYTTNSAVNPDTYPQFPIAAFPTSISTSLNNQTTSLVSMQYCCSMTYYGVDEMAYTNATGTYGLLSDMKTYDYATSPPGPLLRDDQTTYEWQNNNAYYSADFLNLVAQKTTYDGSGDLLEQTNYTYDESSYLTGSGITIQHGSPASPVRGNLTSVTRVLSTGSSPTSHTNWYDTGEPYQQIDPLGHTTTYGYSPTYAGSLPTSVTDAMGYTTTYTYDFNLGLKTSVIDPNQQTTSYAYDTWGRQIQVNYPDGGQTSYCYNDLSNIQCSPDSAAPSVLVTQLQTGTTQIQTESDYDGLARTVLQKTLTDPDGIDSVFTTYDALGRASMVSNPYRSTSDPTYGINQTQYDALGRVLVQTQPDGSYVNWSYSGNVTTYTNELGNSWQQTVDGLGHLTQVIEPGALNTTYQYDALGNLLCADQWASGAPGTPCTSSRARQFKYDNLSRLIQAFNIESGWTCYGTTLGGAAPNGSNCTEGYDADGNLLYKTDAREIAVNYSYDALNRVTSKTYSNPTPTSCYVYDQTFVGKLTYAWTLPWAANATQAPSCPSSGSTAGYQSLRVYGAYDAMGRVVSEQQCVLGFCTSAAPPAAPSANCPSLSSANGLSYCYDLAGDLTAYSNGLNSTAFPQQAILFSQGFDAAGRLSSVSIPNSPSSPWISSPQLPGNLFTVNPTSGYAPFGALQNWTLGANLNVNRTYDDRLRVTGETASQP